MVLRQGNDDAQGRTRRVSTMRPIHCWRAATSVAVALGLAGCRGIQSALEPQGPAAQAIADTWWLMFWGAMAIFLLVMTLLGLALRSGRQQPLRRPERLVMAGGLVLPSVSLLALLIYGTDAGRRIIAASEPSDLVIEVTGRQWQWQFAYLDADGGRVATSTDLLLLPVGRMVEFRIGSDDVIHSFWIPRLGGKMDAIPGKVNTLRLRADGPAQLRGQCSEFCGLSHARMSFAVVAMPGEEFDRWLATRRAPSSNSASAPTHASQPAATAAAP
jgi:cytochrome c oxidase subunit II